MKNHMIKITAFTILLINSSINVNAEIIGSHVHGLSELTIAIEDQTIEIEMASPAMNLVGFEHEAHSKAEIAMVTKITKQLSNSDNIFSFTGGACLLTKTSTDTSSLISNHHVENESHHDSDDHDSATHDDEQHKDHSNHHEVISHYRYHCKKPSTLTAITVKMFDQFSGVNQITARWLTETQQGSVTLSPTKPIIKLR